MVNIYGDTRPGIFFVGLVALGVGLLLQGPDGVADWTAAALLAVGGGQIGRHWGWWQDLSR